MRNNGFPKWGNIAMPPVHSINESFDNIVQPTTHRGEVAAEMIAYSAE